MDSKRDPDAVEEDEYDEEADSDFDANAAGDDQNSSGSEDDTRPSLGQPPRKRRKKDDPVQDATTAIDLDSGDEATIKEQAKAKRKQQKRGEDVEDESETESGGWRARTRAMREQDKEEKQRSRLATSKTSTIDVDKIWEEMNRPGPLPPVHVEGVNSHIDTAMASRDGSAPDGSDKENAPVVVHEEEMITIKRKFQFAGEIHTEEKSVPKSSAEARLWLAQQDFKAQPDIESTSLVQRPLRKISRFDPNYNNLAAYKTNWTRTDSGDPTFRGPKLNVVEKSKMDWAVHVDAEGLKDELDVHAKAKEGYHSRMDFLNQVEQRKDEEARLARMKR